MIPKALGTASFRPIILSVLEKRDSYGYEIMQFARDISDNTLELKPGILYPLLKRFEEDGLVEGYWVHAESERPRRYYRLLKAGQTALNVEKQSWLKIHEAFTQLWGLNHV